MSNVECRTANNERKMSNIKRRTSNVERQMYVERRITNVECRNRTDVYNRVEHCKHLVISDQSVFYSRRTQVRDTLEVGLYDIGHCRE